MSTTMANFPQHAEHTDIATEHHRSKVEIQKSFVFTNIEVLQEGRLEGIKLGEL